MHDADPREESQAVYGDLLMKNGNTDLVFLFFYYLKKKSLFMERTLLILESSAFFKKGQVLENYEFVEGGVNCDDKFVSESQYVDINEEMTRIDEDRVRGLIREQLQEIMFKLHKIK